MSLAALVCNAKCVLVCTGAGISTASGVPDFRSTNGLYQTQNTGAVDCVRVSPTIAHMALSSLVRRGFVHHVVSQNCDGLHLRSGVDRQRLSEVHGNMFVEFCRQCRIEVYQRFDTTRRTSVGGTHCTARRCAACNSCLVDTIVHFGEVGRDRSPRTLNWSCAVAAARRADLIVVLGSSCTVLKSYPLWGDEATERAFQARTGIVEGCYVAPATLARTEPPKVVIVNQEATCKDRTAHLVVHDRSCDSVLEELCAALDVPIEPYSSEHDPLLVSLSLHKPTPHERGHTILGQIPKMINGQVAVAKASGWLEASLKQKRRDDDDSDDERLVRRLQKRRKRMRRSVDLPLGGDAMQAK